MFEDKKSPLQSQAGAKFWAWNPPVENPLPEEVRALQTIFLPGIGTKTYSQCASESNLTGVPPEDLAEIAAGRLALHETVVAANLYFRVPDISDSHLAYGREFRKQVVRLMGAVVEAAAPEIDAVVTKLKATIDRELALDLSLLSAASSLGDRQFLLSSWQSASGDTGGYLPTNDTYRRISKAWALATHHNRLIDEGRLDRNSPEFFEALRLSCVPHIYRQSAAREVFDIVEPLVLKVASRIGIELLDKHDQGVVTVLLKGPPACGKTSYRPTIRKYSKDRHIEWENIRQIDPDAWRPLLQSVSELGEARAYFGQVTEVEATIIGSHATQLAKKRSSGNAHLLIDHFHVDPFELYQVSDFSRRVEYVFCFCKPEQAVERAFKRGQEIDRYLSLSSILLNYRDCMQNFKDLLGRVKWSNTRFVILDNSVPKGAEPTTVASINMKEREMKIFSPMGFMGFCTWDNINPFARSPEDLYLPDSEELKPLAPFEYIRSIHFVEMGSGLEYATWSAGALRVHNQEAFDSECGFPALRKALGYQEQ